MELAHRPKWEIDRQLDSFIGARVRVAAESFCLSGRAQTISAQNLVLPDNSPAAGLHLWFEGTLADYRRRIGVVYVTLDPTQMLDTAQGMIHFRGESAVILQGPASVRLAVPFRVERLPHDSTNYWIDLRHVGAQFNFDF